MTLLFSFIGGCKNFKSSRTHRFSLRCTKGWIWRRKWAAHRFASNVFKHNVILLDLQFFIEDRPSSSLSLQSEEKHILSTMLPEMISHQLSEKVRIYLLLIKKVMPCPSGQRWLTWALRSKVMGLISCQASKKGPLSQG